MVLGLGLALIGKAAAAAEVETPGFVKFEFWRGAVPEGDPPTMVSYASAFDSRTVFPNEALEPYRARMSGWITPVQSGEYRFFMLRGPISELWLSTTDKPADKIRIATRDSEWLFGNDCCLDFVEPDAVGGSSETSKAITLAAGRKYYVELLIRESGWGDFGQVAWRRTDDNTPARLLDPLPGAMLSCLAEPTGAAVRISKSPQSVTASENSTVTFTVEANTSTEFRSYPGGPLSPAYVWSVNGQVVPSARGPSFTTPPLKSSDNQARIQCVVAVPGLAISSDEAIVTVKPDNMAPTLVSVDGTGSFDRVTLTFSEPVDPATATIPTNYVFEPSLKIASAMVKNHTNVILATSVQPPGTGYAVTVNGVRDLSGNALGANTKASFRSWMITRGGLEFQYWSGISVADISIDATVLANPRYPNDPDWTSYAASFNSREVLPDNVPRGYTGRMWGWITPQETASYRFFVASTDTSRLYLSTDATPEKKVQLAQELNCCTPYSEPPSLNTSDAIQLVAGKSYFIELIYRVGFGIGYGQVAWRKEGDPTRPGMLQPIPGRFLSAAVPADGGLVPTIPGPAEPSAAPNVVKIVHLDGFSPWTAANTSLAIDEVPVTVSATKEDGRLTLDYKSDSHWPPNSTHTARLTHPDAAGDPRTLSWSFTVGSYTEDRVRGSVGLLVGAAAHTSDAGGHTGVRGDYAVDFGRGGAGQVVYVPDVSKDGPYLHVPDISFLNATTGDDQMSFSIWQRLYEPGGYSAFWARSPSSSDDQRGWQAHTPYENVVYFDTSGCCEADTRISQNITNLPTYTGDPAWWTSWHHLVFTKKQDIKQVWIDGALLVEGNSAKPLPHDFTDMMVGSFDPIWGNMRGVLDDLAIFDKALDRSQVQALFSGTAPGAVQGNPGLLAHWDFNDPPGAVDTRPRLSVTRSGPVITIASSSPLFGTGYVIETAENISGPWTPQPGVNLPRTVSIGAGSMFVRARKP